MGKEEKRVALPSKGKEGKLNHHLGKHLCEPREERGTGRWFKKRGRRLRETCPFLLF